MTPQQVQCLIAGQGAAKTVHFPLRLNLFPRSRDECT
jgi:hypothetical protein